MTSPPRVIDYAAFPQPPHALFRDYVAGHAKAAPFFAFGSEWDIEAIERAAVRTLRRDFAREALSTALVAQQEARGAGAAAEAARRLRQSETVAIVSGQQPVLFGGPLFVLYKALATLRIAHALEAKRRAPVVPVFWIASDDHDFAEIRALSLLDESGTIRSLRYSPRVEPAGAPASAIALDETVAALRDELTAALPPGEFREAAVARVADAYRAGVTLVEAFARLLSALLPGLVVMDIADRRIKALMTPVLDREIGEASPLSRIVAATGHDLLAAGYHQQVPVREGLSNLFLIEDGVRHPVGFREGRIEIRGTSTILSVDAARQRLAADPASASPGVLLRPLVQDFILPTAAYVAGPAEVAYHAQIGRAYEAFQIPRPVVVPRPGVTLVDPPRARVLEAEGLDIPDLQGDAEGLIGRWVKQAYPEVEDGFLRVRSAAAREMGELARALAAHDPTLEAAVSSTTGRMLHPLDSLQEKSMRALKKRDQARADRLRRAHDFLFPGGSFQERGLGFIGLVARHGEGLLTTLSDAIDPWAAGHQVITL